MGDKSVPGVSTLSCHQSSLGLADACSWFCLKKHVHEIFSGTQISKNPEGLSPKCSLAQVNAFCQLALTTSSSWPLLAPLGKPLGQSHGHFRPVFPGQALLSSLGTALDSGSAGCCLDGFWDWVFVHLSLLSHKFEWRQFKLFNWPSYWSSHWPRSKGRCPPPTTYLLPCILGKEWEMPKHFKNYSKEQYTDTEL